MLDSETKARRCMMHKLTHRAAALRRTADELDMIAAELEASAIGPSEQTDKTDGEERHERNRYEAAMAGCATTGEPTRC